MFHDILDMTGIPCTEIRESPTISGRSGARSVEDDFCHQKKKRQNTTSYDEMR
jgi:hypothetical protein